MGGDGAGNPLEALGAAAQGALRGLGEARGRLEARWEALGAGVARAVGGLASGVREAAAARGRAPLGAAFASLSMGIAGGAGAQPVFDLAMSQEEIKSRLSTIPVYTVTNSSSEFVLVSEEAENGKTRHLGLLFMAEADAQALIDKMNEQDPVLGTDSQIVTVSMDNLYDIFKKPRKDLGMEGVVFRLVPEATQVKNAVGLYQEAGVPTNKFSGVPVFQAEGLSVTGNDNAQYVPFFLSKDDLDVALKTAYTSRGQKTAHEYRDKATKYTDLAERYAAEAEAAGDKRQARKLNDKATKARANADKAREKSAAAAKAAMPGVEVGSLEEVITAMEDDKAKKWDNVVFIQPGSIAPVQAAKK